VRKKRTETVPDESCQRVTKRLADLRGRRRGTVCAAARRMACRHRAKTVPPRAARCRCAPPPPLLKESSRLLHIALGLTSTTPQDHLALASRKSLLTALLSRVGDRDEDRSIAAVAASRSCRRRRKPLSRHAFACMHACFLIHGWVCGYSHILWVRDRQRARGVGLWSPQCLPCGNS
jgi:hypothetical protein